MQQTTLYFFYTLFFCLIFCTSCGEDDDIPCNDATDPFCPNYDPCIAVLPAQSDIVIIDSLFSRNGNRAMGVPVDTLGRGNQVYFRPAVIRSDANYEWKIGTDARVFTNPILDLNFTGFAGRVDVRLITIINDELGCLSIAEAIDTSYSAFYVNDLPTEDFPVLGAFLGTTDANPADEFVLEVYLDEIPFSGSKSRFRGVPIDCYEDGLPASVAGGYDWFMTTYTLGDFRCRELMAIGRLREKDHRVMEIDYSYIDDAGNLVEEHFVGYRQ